MVNMKIILNTHMAYIIHRLAVLVSKTYKMLVKMTNNINNQINIDLAHKRVKGLAKKRMIIAKDLFHKNYRVYFTNKKTTLKKRKEKNERDN